MSTNSDKMKRYERLAVKKPKYYVSIGNIYIEEGAFKAATIYYQKAVDNGVLAYTVLGDTWGYRSQYKKAFDAYTEGANKGEAECFARLGFCYETGYVKIDIQKAIECYVKASDLGVAAAARSLGDLYYFNTPIEDSEIEYVKNALKCYERAFYLGDIEVAKKIGFIYLNNEELKDVPKAIEWYEKGLSLGDHSLNFDLAYVYLNDRFVPHDYKKGLAYLVDGVKHNDPESLYLQARIYEDGLYGIEPDKSIFIISKRRRTFVRMTHCLIWGITITKRASMTTRSIVLRSAIWIMSAFIGVWRRFTKPKKPITKMRCSIIRWQWKWTFRTQSNEWRKRISATN